MSTQITANEHGKVRVFQLSATLASVLEQEETFASLASALGVSIADPDDVQIVADAVLRDLGLAQFLMMGYGIAEAEIGPEMEALNTLTGSFAVIRSGAFGEAATTLRPSEDAALIATFHEEGAAPAPLTPLQADSAQGTVADPVPPVKKPKSDARIGGMVATLALLVLFALVGLMIWIAG